MIKLELTVPPYLCTYLKATYGTNYRVSTNDDLGILILNTLKKKSYYYTHIKHEDVRLARYPINISMSMFEKYGCTLSEEQMFQIYKSVDSNFRRNMYIFAIVNKEYLNIQYKDSLEKFFQAYGISEDELSYGTIRKDFNRKKGKLLASLNSGQY